MLARQSVVIQPIGFEAPVARAADELASYLPRLAPIRARLLRPLPTLPRDSDATIVLGTADSLRGLGIGRLPRASRLDDALAILPGRGRLWLVGSNARSVLFAAYRLLEELGVVFLRPGPGGEVVPSRPRLSFPKQAIREAASYRHRGICIEGYPRLEHVLALLDWMAKKKMNCFQIQFRHGGAFWRRGYVKSPEMPPDVRSHGLTEEDYLAIDNRVAARMRELGMMLHKVGHGWTANVLGYAGISWREQPDHPLPADRREWCAEVDGKRGLFRNEPTNTELCYSKPEVRDQFVNEVVRYARQHSEVDYLQVWLSDATNNKCECDECRKRTITDWYLLLIAEIDRRLKAEALPVQIVFIAYQELLWPPTDRALVPKDVAMMYAPMGRCYRHAFTDEKCDVDYETRRPPVNRFRQLSGNRAAAALARQWKGLTGPDSFLFDYYGWRATWEDGLGLDLADSVARDMGDLDELGLNGMMSCQCIRAFYPLPVWPSAMAEFLWNRRASRGAHRRRIMSAAFGPRAADVEKYFSAMIRLWRAGDTYEHATVLTGDVSTRRPRLERIARFAEEARQRFAGLARRHSDEVVRVSLELVALHAEQARRIAEAHLAGIRGDLAGLARMQAEYERRLPEVLGRLGFWVDPMLGEPVAEALAQASREARTARRR
jgi:hypothetical protein